MAKYIWDIRIGFLILIGIVIFAIFKGCGNTAPLKSHSDTTIVVYRDTGSWHMVQPLPGPIQSSKPYVVVVNPTNPLKHDTVWQKIDTSKVIEAYYQIHRYSDTQAVNHPFVKGKIFVDNIVTQNGLLSQRISDSLQVEQITNTIVEKNKPQILIGGEILNLPQSLNLGVNMAYRSPSGNQFEVGALVPLKTASLGWKIGFKKVISFKK